MRKLKMEELGRLNVAEYKAAAKNPIVVVLDNIRSKQNVGSVFRSSDAFRVAHLYLCGYTPIPPDRDIAKTALGAHLSVDWSQHQDALTLVQSLKEEGYTLLSLEQAEGSVALQEFHRDPEKKYALILGNEVDGVQQEIVNISDTCLEIPQFGTKHSLNVSVATGIALFSLCFRVAST